MRNIAILFFVLLGVSFSSCHSIIGTGDVVTVQRKVSDFSQVNSSISGKVIITQGNEYKVTVKAQQNIADVLETYLENDVLIIKYKNNTMISTNEQIEVDVTLPKVIDVSLEGSGDIVISNGLTADNLSLDISGSGSIISDQLIAKKLEVAIAGSGDLKVKNGNADNGDLSISGSGSIDLNGMKFQKCSVRVAGSGDAKVNAAEKLDVSIAGSGSVYYIGNPAISQKISGSGSVQKQ